MIYLLRTPADNGTLLKIGYTTDNKSWKRRLDTYKSHNPDIKVVQTIPEGTRLHEVALHDKFRNYLERGKEWFKDVQEIEEYIKTVKLEDIDVDKFKIKQDRVDRSALFTPYIKTAWEELERRKGVDNKILIEHKKPSVLQQFVTGRVEFRELQDLWDYLEFTESEIEHVLYLMEGDFSDLPKELSDFLNNFPSLSNVDKYRSLCTLGPTLSEEDLEILFKQIPTNFGEHYRSIGPDKILSTGCNVTFMNKYLHDLNNPFKPENLDAEIYSNFSEGQRYKLTDIKDILKVIYQNNDVQKTAKATDLSNYFETKAVLVALPDKSRVNGLKLIKKLR